MLFLCKCNCGKELSWHHVLRLLFMWQPLEYTKYFTRHFQGSFSIIFKWYISQNAMIYSATSVMSVMMMCSTLTGYYWVRSYLIVKTHKLQGNSSTKKWSCMILAQLSWGYWNPSESDLYHLLQKLAVICEFCKKYTLP